MVWSRRTRDVAVWFAALISREGSYGGLLIHIVSVYIKPISITHSPWFGNNRIDISRNPVQYNRASGKEHLRFALNFMLLEARKSLAGLAFRGNFFYIWESCQKLMSDSSQSDFAVMFNWSALPSIGWKAWSHFCCNQMSLWSYLHGHFTFFPFFRAWRAKRRELRILDGKSDWRSTDLFEIPMLHEHLIIPKWYTELSLRYLPVPWVSPS